MNTESTKYNRKWFKERAVSSIKNIDKGVWDFSDSLLFYTSNESTDNYKASQIENTNYSQLVTKPERKYLSSIAPIISSKLPKKFDYIDLGPGTEHKEQIFFDQFKNDEKSFVYIPVDINQYYLNLAIDHAAEQEIPLMPIHSSFEELPKILKKTKKPRFISLGLTFSNYEAKEIIKLLEDISGSSGYIFINVQIKGRVDIEKLEKDYLTDAEYMCNNKIKLLDLDPKKDVSPKTIDDGIKIYCSIIKTNKILDKIGIKIGDKIILARSLRYTKEALEKELQKTNMEYFMFDTGESFIASLLIKK